MTPLLLLVALATPAPADPPLAQAQLERELKSWVQTRISRVETSEMRYEPVLVDLNGDNALEALVYVSGRDRCGSGGCTLYILQRRAGCWRLVNSVTLANPPVRRLTTRSRGWSDIGLTVRGGGIGPAYEAVLRFDGVRYPGNPTVPPAFRARPGVAGRTLIPVTPEGRPLFP